MTGSHGGREVRAEPIAIIGMQGRFPGAASVDELWKNLLDGVESIQDFTEAELMAAGVDPAYLDAPGFVKRGSVIGSIDQFDAAFFGYSPRDAETIDPQQRIFMEVAWEALELAGCDPERYDGLIGVFAGCDQSSYIYQIYNSVDLSAFGYGGMMSIGNEKDYLATQVSYKFNLRGPSLTVQTSCSTSLVSVVTACQNLAHGYCDVAIAGGAAISVPQKKGYWYQAGGIVSPDGHCRPFDAQAMGTVVGSGVAVVVLKRLADAVRDGDRITAVIKGFALNNDGGGKVGYTAPSVEGQIGAIRSAQRMAGVDAGSIGYIEAHGTATALGDPIETTALTKAFRETTDKRQFCAIGSLKSNVGHLSSSAGVSGLIKCARAVEAGRIPRSLHFTAPNPQIDFESSPLFVPTETIDWPLKGPRRAGVSSFGVGGTNAHIVLEEAPPAEAGEAPSQLQLITLSARTESALEQATDNLARFIAERPDVDLADVAHTLQVGRKAFPRRRAMIVDRDAPSAAAAALHRRDPDWTMNSTGETAATRSVVFMFSGQGTQYPGMGLGLYRSEPIYREAVDACAEILLEETGTDIRELIHAEQGLEEAAARLRRTENAQPALFTVEYALARLWMARLGEPAAMLGHSIGEYVAATIAGVMSLPDALGLVAARGRLMGAMAPGAMLVVPLPESALQAVLGPEVSLAAVNAPSLGVLAGPESAIAAAERDFAASGLPTTRLHTSHAFHSAMMEPCLPEFLQRLQGIALKPPLIPYLSNVTGDWIVPALATSPDYWASHIRMTVRFSDNLAKVMEFPDLALVEVGPGHTLQILAGQQGPRAAAQLLVPSLRAAAEAVPDEIVLLHSTARLWLAGADIDWRGMRRDQRPAIVPLPTYPFERKRYWIGPIEDDSAAHASGHSYASSAMAPIGLDGTPINTAIPQPGLPAARTDVADWFYTPKWHVEEAAAVSLEAASGTRWLLLGDGEGAAALAAALETAGAQVSRAVRGDSFSAGATVSVRPDRREDFEALVEHLRGSDATPDYVVHLWAAEPARSNGDDVAALEAALADSFYSVVHLGQALARAGGGRPVHVGVAGGGLHVVSGGETPSTRGATAEAACRAVTQEYPHLQCRLIDSLPGEADSPSRLAAELLRRGTEATVALRDGRRWIRRYEPVRLAAPAQRPALLGDGVYVITGGLGNIGLVLAEAIARTAKARLVLAGRSPFPPREEWDSHLARGGSQVSRQIRRIRDLEALGAEVMLASVDVTDAAQVAELARDVRATWGPVHGIVHAAARLDKDAFVPVMEIDRSTGDAQFAPKARGLLNLEAAFGDEPRLWLLLSSISVALGGLNLGAYAAGNAFLDAEAARQNRLGGAAWVSVNWDAWDFADPNAREAVTPAKGIDAFLRLMAADLRQVVVAAAPLAPRLAKWAVVGGGSGTAASTASSANGSGQAAAHPRPDLNTPFVAPRTATEKEVAQVWEHFLGVAPVGIHDRFFELGGHSLLAIQVLARLRELFGIDIPVQRLFETPAIAELSASIDRDLVGRGGPSADGDGDGDGDGDEMQRMMELVDGLSDEEVEALLAEVEAREGAGNHA